MESETEKAFVVHNISSKRTETVQLPEGTDMPIVYMANPGAEVKTMWQRSPAETPDQKHNIYP